MLAGVRTEINERLERYNDTLWRPYALFPPFCYICLRHCACRNGGHPLSPVFIFNRPSVRCNDLARYPGRMPRGVSCVSCFVGSLLLSYVIWGTADSPLTQRSTRTDERETRHPQDAIFTETIAVMSCLLFCCRVSWRVVPEPWGMPPVTAASIGLALLIRSSSYWSYSGC